MANLETIRREVEEMCANPRIPEECKASFDEFWETVRRALVDPDAEINDALGA